MKVKIHTPFVYRQDKKYRYVLERPLSLTIEGIDMGRHRYMDDRGQVWLDIDGDHWLIHSQYAWDGASSAPDFRKCLLGTLVHDVGYQFLDVKCFPFTRIQVDLLFDAVMKSQGFWLSWIYSRAVMVFGGIHRKWGGKKRPLTYCNIHHKSSEQ